jgi:hypothetical protein
MTRNIRAWLCIVTVLWTFTLLPSVTLAGFWDNTPTRDEDPPERQYLDEVIRPDGTVEYGVDIVRLLLFCGSRHDPNCYEKERNSLWLNLLIVFMLPCLFVCLFVYR